MQQAGRERLEAEKAVEKLRHELRAAVDRSSLMESGRQHALQEVAGLRAALLHSSQDKEALASQLQQQAAAAQASLQQLRASGRPSQYC